MYVITGATGNTGKPIAEILLKNGKNVTIISRDADKVKELTEKGAKAAIGDLTDSDFLSETFKNATAVYAMVPPNFIVEDFSAYQHTSADALVNALKNSSVKHVVTLSSVGAHSDQTGVVAGLHYMENKFKELKEINVLHLRAGYFFSNLFNEIHLLKAAGIFGGMVKGDIKFPMVHTNDIGEVGAKHLLNLNFEGHSHTYVAGAEDLSFNDVASIIGKAINKTNLNYMQFPYEQAKEGMLKAGLKEGLANGYLKFSKSINEGILSGDFKRTPEYTTPSHLENFIQNEWLKVYNS